MTPVIRTLAGRGDGLRKPTGIRADAAGRVYVADSNRCAVRAIDPDGTMTTVAGGNGRGFAGDGGPATEAQLALPTAVWPLPSGELLIADRENDAIRAIDLDGTIRTVVGGNGRGYAGDGGPATEAVLFRPRDVVVGPDGTMWIADRDNHAIRRVDVDGTITTAVGGRGGYGGDGGPATRALIKRPRGVAVGPDRAVYVIDRNNHAIRRVDPDGTISTWAGGNGPGRAGDGGPARSAQLDHPSGIAFDPAGVAFVSDHLNDAVRRIGEDGTITTPVGGNGPGAAGDGGPADRAQLHYPCGVAVDGLGNLYIADRENHAVRVVEGIAAPAADAT